MPVDPQVQAFLDMQAQVAAEDPPPPVREQSPEFARQGYRAMAEMLPTGAAVEVENRAVPGPAGEIPIRIYTPGGEGPFGVLVYYHGGGWVIGDLETHDHACRAMCEGAGCVVVSVDYRLAPEHVFPAAVDDALAAFRWVSAQASTLGGDPDRVAVGGDSAGGNLAAVVSLLARDDGGSMPVFQLLVYPAVDMTFAHGSIDENADGYVLTKEHMVWFRGHYLSSKEQRQDWRASPLFAESHANLPPALVITAEFDPLRDEGAAYSAKLEAAGVPTKLSAYEGMVHVFFQLSPLIEGGQRAMNEACAALREALAPAS